MVENVGFDTPNHANLLNCEYSLWHMQDSKYLEYLKMTIKLIWYVKPFYGSNYNFGLVVFAQPIGMEICQKNRFTFFS